MIAPDSHATRCRYCAGTAKSASAIDSRAVRSVSTLDDSDAGMFRDGGAPENRVRHFIRPCPVVSMAARQDALTGKATELRGCVSQILRSLRNARRGQRISAHFAKGEARELARAAEFLAEQIRDTYGLDD